MSTWANKKERSKQVKAKQASIDEQQTRFKETYTLETAARELGLPQEIIEDIRLNSMTEASLEKIGKAFGEYDAKRAADGLDPVIYRLTAGEGENMTTYDFVPNRAMSADQIILDDGMEEMNIYKNGERALTKEEAAKDLRARWNDIKEKGGKVYAKVHPVAGRVGKAGTRGLKFGKDAVKGAGRTIQRALSDVPSLGG